MKIIVFVVFIIAVFQYSEGKKLGEDCSSDNECKANSPYFECKQEQNVSPTCKCISGKKQQGENCIDILQSDCSSNSDCAGEVGAICESGKCVCKDGRNPENRKCVTASIDGKCQGSTDCKPFMGDFSVCQEGKCICQENYHLSNNICTTSKHLNEACESDAECTQMIGNENALRCNSADKKCVCKDNYKVDGDECSNANPLIASITLLFAVYIAIKIF